MPVWGTENTAANPVLVGGRRRRGRECPGDAEGARLLLGHIPRHASGRSTAAKMPEAVGVCPEKHVAAPAPALFIT